MARRILMLAAAAALFAVVGVSSAAASAPPPTGEHLFGQVAIEPAINDQTGGYTYLLTPIKAPLPTKANVAHATAPLYLVMYPHGWDTANPGVTLNCQGPAGPDNCPDHDGVVAAVATGGDPLGTGEPGEPTVYGTDPTVIPGHDHLVAVPASGGDFNVAWMVVEVMFTPAAVSYYGSTGQLPHVTTESQLSWLEDQGYVHEVNLFPFTCAVVSSTLYTRSN